ncbi:peptidoglycan DD-metalloendopeptidase family protein [Kangiella sp.]|uniref:murein hydrolase activator EnvC family protein n=1 Tax=Kangiella sp. TaxID=1920245 RepID=UPI001988DE55|nr:peptidoglycan DD-metalloendopeptidase family protein [Kangiella sp.]MBD3654628.1 peptidoglycan DD-metalloendopeptidase family protein [Kangiella sp.]
MKLTDLLFRSSLKQVPQYLLLVLVILFSPLSLSAQDQQQAEQELEQLKQVISQLQKQLAENRSQQSDTEKAIQAIDVKLSAVSKELRDTQTKITQNKRQLNQLKKQKTEKNILKEKQRKQLASQLRSAYIAGQEEYIKLLLNQEDPAKISRMLQYYRYLNKARIRDIEALQKTLQELEQVEQQINSTTLELTQLEAQQKQQVDQQLALKSAQTEALKALKKEYQNQNTRLAQLRKDEQELQAIISSLQKTLEEFAPKQSLKGLAQYKNKLNWPVKGSIQHRFGSNKFENKVKWNGIVINASSGQIVQSIHNGQVVFADWLRGFGLMVIIDHGQGYMSLYGQNESLLKSTGDWVEAGEPVATVGRSGGSTEPGLYFEIRYKGKPQNPVNWIK